MSEQGDGPFGRSPESVPDPSARMGELIHLLGSFGRPIHLEHRELSLNDVAGEALWLLPAASPVRIRLRQVRDAELGVVRGDAGELRELLRHLMVNAAEAMPDGGMISVRTRGIETRRPLPVVGGALPPGRWARLRVRDGGPGIPADALPRVFDPFFTTKNGGGGGAAHLGLGLPIALGIARRHGGGLRLRACPGGGTVVDLLLPARDGATAAEAAAAPLHAPAPRSSRVLVVEDDADVLRLYRAVLSRAGHEVLSVATAAEAEQLFRREAGRVDAVILEAVLPDGPATSVVDAIRRLDPHVPVVVASAHDEGEVPLALLRLRRSAFLPKPFPPSQLVATLRCLLASPGAPAPAAGPPEAPAA